MTTATIDQQIADTTNLALIEVQGDQMARDVLAKLTMSNKRKKGRKKYEFNLF